MNATPKRTNKGRHFISTLLAFALVFSIFTAIPVTASAANATAIAAQINAFYHGGNGTLVATASGNTVTVKGSVTDVKYPLELDLTLVTIIWTAEYSAEPFDPNTSPNLVQGQDDWVCTLITLTGEGTFQLEAGSSVINRGKGNAIVSYCTSLGIVLEGGTVKATGEYSAIILDGINNSVIMHDGLIEASGDGYPIFSYAEASSIYLHGGTVRNTVGQAISCYPKPLVPVTGAPITEYTGSLLLYAIGATVISEGYGSAIYSQVPGAEIDVSGGTITGGEDPAIFTIGDDSHINIFSGTLTSSSYAIYAEGANTSITVNGGDISTPRIGYGAICSFGDNTHISIYDGVISGTGEGGYAVYSTDTTITVDATGGFLFAAGDMYQRAIGVHQSSTVNIGGEAVVCTWRHAPGEIYSYIEGSSTELNANPGASVKWGRSGAQNGIYYANGANTGFFPISGITITDGYVVTFNSNGGSAVASQAISPGGVAERPSPNPTRTLFSFSGWYSDATLTTLYDFSSPVTANITLYAKWTVSAVFVGTIANFVPIRVYPIGLFSDVSEDAWYGLNQQKVIANAYEYGLMQGSGTGFNPRGNMTLAEAITVAARVRNIYDGGDGEFTQGIPWYQVYVDYAIENDIIAANDFTGYNEAATRAEMAYIFSRALPESEFQKQNTVNALPDVSAGSDPASGQAVTAYSDSIIMLYEAGVVGGDEGTHAFRPGDNISRAEAAAVISRVILPSTRANGETFD